MASLHGEIRAVSLQEEKRESGHGSFHRVRGDNLIDLDELPLYPLMTEQALANELETRLGDPYIPASARAGNSSNAVPDDSAARHDHIRLTVTQNKQVLNRHFRFIVSHGESVFTQDDAKCKKMFRKLGVPFARVAPGAVDDANVEKLMGVTSSTLETLFRQFLKLLYQANQPLKPEPSAANPKMDELVKVLLSLLKENEAVKAQLSSAVEKLEGNKAAPESATLKEVMDMAKKGQEGVTAYADVWSRIYTATRTLLDFLQS